MAHDDMSVVICKVLDYLNRCGKSGRIPDPESLSPEALGIPRSWWTTCLSEIADRGLASGFARCDTMSGKDIVVSDPAITLEGAECLSENSSMKRAYKWLKEVRGLLPL